MEVDFISAFENARTNAPSCRITRETIEVLTLFSQRCAVRTAHSITCTYNWMTDYTIIMLVHIIT